MKKGLGLGAVGERTAEVQADDCTEQVGIERGHDEAAQGDPLRFFSVRAEEPESLADLGKGHVYGSARHPHRHDFREGHDEEDGDQRDGATCPLEARVGKLSRGLDVFELFVHGLDAQKAFLAFIFLGGGDEFHHAAEERGAEQRDEFSGKRCDHVKEVVEMEGGVIAPVARPILSQFFEPTMNRHVLLDRLGFTFVLLSKGSL